jgi:NAD-dependent DNA ligase
MVAAGWEIGDAVSKKTTLLVVADGTDVEGEGSGKLKKARSMNIKIQNLTQIRELFP